MFTDRSCKERKKTPDKFLLSLASDLEPEEAARTNALEKKSQARLGKAFVC